MNSFYFQKIDDFYLLNNVQDKMWLLLVAEHCDFDYEELKSKKLACYGGIFPEIIYGEKHYNTGLIALELDFKPIFLNDIDNAVLDAELINKYDSLLVYVDGLSIHIDSFLVKLFEVTKEETKILGGGAGKLTLKQEPVIFTPSNIMKDSALIIPLKQKLSIGVNHGWEFLEGPFVATKSKKNTLYQINYKNAFDVYKKIVEEDSKMKINSDNFYKIAKSYPLGIVTYEKDMIVRAPITVKNNNLVLVGEIPTNSVINILKGNKHQLIFAALEASKEATCKCNEDENSFAIVVDCISRSLYLEEFFEKEIKQIIGQVPNPSKLIGTLSLGEIANESDSFITFYNNTCVVGILC
ncbi:MAG: FIST C-terminal domain-containing protein [Halarcobacter sp.]